MCPCRRHDDQRLEIEEHLFADAFDVHQVFDLLEAANLLPVLDDARGHGEPDARSASSSVAVAVLMLIEAGAGVVFAGLLL